MHNTRNPIITIILKITAFICLALFVILISIILYFYIEEPSNEKINLYLLPYAYKHDFNFGVDKYEIMQTFRTGSLNREALIMHMSRALKIY